VDAGLDTLATALYVRTDDLLKTCPQYAPWRPSVGISPELSDAELVTLAVPQAPVHPAHQPTHQVSVKKRGFAAQRCSLTTVTSVGFQDFGGATRSAEWLTTEPGLLPAVRSAHGL
jgi:hypothetical protein